MKNTKQIIIHGDTAAVLEKILSDITKSYAVTTNEATNLFVETALRCINKDEFYEKLEYLLDWGLFPIVANPHNVIGAVEKYKKIKEN